MRFFAMFLLVGCVGSAPGGGGPGGGGSGSDPGGGGSGGGDGVGKVLAFPGGKSIAVRWSKVDGATSYESHATAR